MFIHYCDLCGMRVDNAESITVETKVFCKECAEKNGLKASSSGSHTGRSGSGPMAGGRPSGSGLHRNERSGLHATGASGTVRRSPPTGNRQVISPAKTASPRAGVSQMRTAVGARGTPKDNSKLAVMSLAAAGVILAVLGLILMMRGKPKPQEQDTSSQTAQVETQTDKKPQATEPVKTPVVTTQTTPITQPNPTNPTVPVNVANTEPEPSKKPAAEVDMSDIREGAAMRELTRLQDLEKDGKSNPFEIRRRYERFVSTYRSTKPGKDAAEHLKTIPEMTQRTPDVADKAEPGVQAKIYEKSFGGETISGNNIKDSKFIATKVLNEVNMPNKGALEAGFGRGDNTAVQITGFVDVPADGTYSFYTTSDDGSLFYLGELLLVNNDGSHGMVEVGDSFPLKKGKHRFRLDYCQGFGDAGLVLQWSGPGIEKQPIPASALSHIND